MNELIKLLTMTEDSCLRYAADQLRPYGEILTDNKNYIVINTGHPLALMAHCDTVKILGVKPLIEGQVISNAIPGEPLGADDRAGVYAILEVCRRLRHAKQPIPNVILTTGEESGGVGAKCMIKDNVLQDSPIRLILALDRRGANDWVEYCSNPKQVHTYVEQFGFVEANGSYSDVADLNSAYKIPGVNLSIGYYAQHTGKERLHTDELYMTIGRVYRMCRKPIEQKYVVEDVKSRWGGLSGYASYWENSMYDRWDLDAGYTDDFAAKDPDDPALTAYTKDLDPNEYWQISDEVDVKITSIIDDWHKCHTCGSKWQACDCGYMFDRIVEIMEPVEIEILLNNWVSEKDPIYDELCNAVYDYDREEVCK
jgi:Peptidase family M28